MNYRETESPLNAQPELWDGQPDLDLGQGHLEDVCRVLSDTASLLQAPARHPGGSVSAYEERIADTRFRGWILHRPPASNIDISLTLGQSPQAVCMYALSGIEYADGAKAVLGDEGVRMQPLIREQYIFVDIRSDRRIEWLRRLAYENVAMPSDEQRLNERQLQMMHNARVDTDRFTIYSLHKINKLLDCLRTDSRLA